MLNIRDISAYTLILLIAGLNYQTVNTEQSTSTFKVFGSIYASCHYDDVIMTTMASQITSLKVVYSTIYSDADQRKHQSSASLAFVWGIHRDRWIPRTKGQLRGKCFHLMTSSCVISDRKPVVKESNLPTVIKVDAVLMRITNKFFPELMKTE